MTTLNMTLPTFLVLVNNDSTVFLTACLVLFPQMEKYPFFVVLFCATFTATVLGYPYGDVVIACDSMLPDHGIPPQKSPPPFVISVAFDRFDPGNEMQGKLHTRIHCVNLPSSYVAIW